MRKIKLLFLLFGLIIWFIGAIALNLIYTTKKMRDAYASPNVRVQLSEPIYGVSGITPINNGDFYLKKIDNVFVAARSNGYLFSTKDCQAYVSMEKSVIHDSLSNDQHVLSRGELCSFLSDLCGEEENKKATTFEIKDFNQYISYGELWLYGDVIVIVRGRYEGTLVLDTSHPSFLIHETNFNQVWSESEHFPRGTVIVCLIVSMVVALSFVLFAYFLFFRIKKISLCIVVMTIPVLYLMIRIIFLYFAGYFMPI